MFVPGSLLTIARGWRLPALFGAGILLAGYLFWARPYLNRTQLLGAAQHAVAEDRLDDARRHIEAYLDARSDDPAGQMLASRIARLRGDFQRARKHLKECDRLLEGTTDDGLQLERCLLWAQTEDVADVEATLLARLTQKDPQASLIMEALAFAYIREYRFKAALGCLNKLLEDEPENVRALYWRGWVRERLDYAGQAVQDYEQVLQLVPDHLKARLRLTELFLRQKKLPEASQHLSVLRERHADAEGVPVVLARGLALEGKTTVAREMLDAFLASKVGDATALYERALLERERAHQEPYLRKALKLKPGFQEARYALFTCLEAQKRSKEAAAVLERYQRMQADTERLKKVLDKLAAQPDDPDLLAQAGKLLLETGKEKAGRVLLTRALAPRRANGTPVSAPPPDRP